MTLVQVDLHIALTETLLRGMTVLLSCDNVAPLMEPIALDTMATVAFSEGQGRLRLEITEDVLIYFIDHCFSVTITMLLHVSLTTGLNLICQSGAIIILLQMMNWIG